MTSVWVAAGVAVALLVIDQLALWAERRGWLYWRKRKPGSAGPSGGILTGLIEVFEPGHRHVVEEQEWRRNATTQRQSGDRPFDIDLDGGTVRLPPEEPDTSVGVTGERT